MTHQPAPTVGSLFSGIGGLDLGLERAGWRVVWQAETDDYASRVLRRAWPTVPNLGDVSEVDWRGVERPTLVCGGFPCQPVSLAGRRRGVDDARWLWPEFARALRVLRPRLALVENVPGLFVRGMGEVLGELAELGYDAEWECLPALAFGAPHLRWRVFVVARLAPSGGLPDPGGDAVRLVGERGGEQHREPGPALTRNDGVPGDMADADRRGREVERQPEPAGERGEGRRLPDRRSPLRELVDAAPAALDLADADDVGRDGRAGEDDCPRPQSADGGRRQEPMADPDVEGLAEREGVGGDARPQRPPAQRGRRVFSGLPGPDDWWAVEPDVGRVANGIPSRVDRLRCLGNAVVPQVAEWIGRRIREEEGV